MKQIRKFNENEDHDGLLKDMRSLHLNASFDKISKKEQQIYMDIVIDILGEALHCNRVWSAWSHNTMGPNDFNIVADDYYYVYEKAEMLYNKTLGVK